MAVRLSIRSSTSWAATLNATTRRPAGPCTGKIEFSTSSAAGWGGAGDGGADEEAVDDDDEDDDDDAAMAVQRMLAPVIQPNSYGGRQVMAIRGHKKVMWVQKGFSLYLGKVKTLLEPHYLFLRLLRSLRLLR